MSDSAFTDPPKIRLDKWLWAARFFKTRALATEAVSGGKVHLNEARVKPARALRLGDVLAIQRGEQRMTVVVRGLTDRRGPAKQAALLYEETDDSAKRRALLAEQRKLRAQSMPHPGQRPDKRQRRKIVRFIRRDSAGD